jgi:hypothetical protein
MRQGERSGQCRKASAARAWFCRFFFSSIRTNDYEPIKRPIFLVGIAQGKWMIGFLGQDLYMFLFSDNSPNDRQAKL